MTVPVSVLKRFCWHGTKISLEGENVRSSHSNVFVVWGENLYSLLCSGLNLVCAVWTNKVVCFVEFWESREG